MEGAVLDGRRRRTHSAPAPRRSAANLGAHSIITTTVPDGATTGRVEVLTPRGTLKSNAVFRVKP